MSSKIPRHNKRSYMITNLHGWLRKLKDVSHIMCDFLKHKEMFIIGDLQESLL